MIKTFSTLLVTGSLLVTPPLMARDISIEVTNLTNAIYFTPLLIAAHDRHTDLFEVGEHATVDLQAMAEGGDTSGLITQLEANSAVYDTDPVPGLLAPGMSTETTLKVRGRANARLSLVGMLLPSNDGFIGMDSVKIPRHRGTYTYYAKAYDAGTEANDEIINGGGMLNVLGIPADPGGNAGTGGVSTIGSDHNDKIHVHRGILGDLDPTGGISDLDSSVHRFQNPVARIVVRVGGKPEHDDDD
ncbi:MAG: spondin domain-containing protein [Gammaproteobacteria bacterium]|nr:spondin domain-containing protein [Gammaproteobacteria bacterium]